MTKEAEAVVEEIKEELEERDISGNLFAQSVERNKQEYGEDFITQRDRGILSPEDREYLWEQTDYAYEQSKYKARERIRNRVTNAIKDFTDLEFNLSEEDRSRIFDNFDGDLETNLIMTLRFLYRAADCDEKTLESIVDQAVYEVERDQENQRENSDLLTVNVSIDIDRTPDMDKLTERLATGEALSDREIGMLVRNGDLTGDDLENLPDSSREITLERILKQRQQDNN